VGRTCRTNRLARSDMVSTGLSTVTRSGAVHSASEGTASVAPGREEQPHAQAPDPAPRRRPAPPPGGYGGPLLYCQAMAAAVLIVILVLVIAGLGVAVARRPRKERIDPFTVQDPWRTMVRRAQSTATRFDDAVRKTKAGPLRERLSDIGRRVTVAVDEAWAVAKRGHALDDAVEQLKAGDTRRRLAELEQAGGGDPAITQSVRNQLQSAERLAGVAQDARTRLQRLNASLEETVARAIELSVSAPDSGALQPLGADLDSVVDELESLRLALEETASGP